MNNSQIISRSLINALGTLAYISLVAFFMHNGESIFGKDGETFLIPVFLLMLFVVSATITGLLVLGKPLQLYIAGHKKEGITLLGATLGWLVVFLALVIVIQITLL